jgi:hypothetical protein
MSSELITIGCKLPHGLKIEVGIDHIPGVWDSVANGPNYACAVGILSTRRATPTYSRWQR